MTLDRATLLELARIRDPLGVLSIYATANPEEQAARRPPWEVRVRTALRDLEERVKEEGPRERWSALRDRVRELDGDIAHLLDPRESGLGRALLARLSGGEPRTLRLQLPLGERVVLEDHAVVRPLLTAADAGSPTGVVAVSRSGLRVVDLRAGRADDLLTLEFQEATGDWRPLEGPAAANPGLPQQTAPQRDTFERRLEEHRLRFLASASERIARLGAEQGWSRVVVAGDPRLTAAVEERLGGDGGMRVIDDERGMEWFSASDVAAAVAPLLEEDRERVARDLVERARGSAMAGGAGALGLAETLAGLAEGRVERLLLDAGRSWEGVRAPDGRLAPEGQVPPGADPAQLVPEPHLGERMIEVALESDAAVTPVSGAAADLLEESDGVAAILRW